MTIKSNEYFVWIFNTTYLNPQWVESKTDTINIGLKRDVFQIGSFFWVKLDEASSVCVVKLSISPLLITRLFIQSNALKISNFSDTINEAFYKFVLVLTSFDMSLQKQTCNKAFMFLAVFNTLKASWDLLIFSFFCVFCNLG